jgi:hypothetical protein|tara:strand:+ start:5120 stop:6925 length:1806 start_codon:yes stop_codon:yes gene_type:complete
MKIILSHSSQSINRDIPWIYFGSSFSKMNYWVNRLSKERINLQYEIHKQGEIQKKNYLEWTESQRITNNDSINWWVTHIACRNNTHTNFFEIICQFFAIKRYLEKNIDYKEILIICENSFFLKLLSENFTTDHQLIYSRFLKFYNFKEILNLRIKGLFNRCKLIILLILNFLFAKFTKPKKILHPSGNIALFHHTMKDVGNVKDGKIKSNYFTILPKWIENKGIKVYFLPWLFNNYPTLNFYKNLRKINTFIPEDWLNLKDYYNIFKNYIKTSKTLSYKVLYPEVKLNNLIYYERLLQLQEQSIIFLRYIPAFKKWSKDLKSILVYDQYQNLPSEHTIRYIVNKSLIKSTTFGYSNCLTSKKFMSYHYLKSEWESKIKPNYIICTGNMGFKILSDQGIPSEKLILAGDLKEIFSERKTLNKNPSKNLLILLSMVSESAIETLTKVYANNSLIIDNLKLKVKVKMHPFSETQDILKKMKWKKLPVGWDWAKKELSSELEDSYCCIAMDTASVYDAIFKGNIVISLMSEHKLMENYLDVYSNKYSIVNSVSEKDLPIRLKDVFLDKTDLFKEEFSQIRRDLINGINKVDSTNFMNFIKDYNVQ